MQRSYIDNNGFGAIELTARYSFMDFTNFPLARSGDKISNITAGINWYLNVHSSLMDNYTVTYFNAFNLYGNHQNLHGHLIRLQVNF